MKTFKSFIAEANEAEWNGKYPKTASKFHPKEISNFNNHRKSFTKDHAEAMAKYKRGSAGNDALRTNAEEKNNHAQTHKHLDHVTNQALLHPTTVYRSFGREFDHSPLKPGHTFTDHGYTGTTPDPTVAKKYAGEGYGGWGAKETKHIAAIHLHPGVKAHYLDLPNHPMSQTTHFTGDKELLLHRGTTFKVHHVEDIKHKDGPMKFYHLHVAGQE